MTNQQAREQVERGEPKTQGSSVHSQPGQCWCRVCISWEEEESALGQVIEEVLVNLLLNFMDGVALYNQTNNNNKDFKR